MRAKHIAAALAGLACLLPSGASLWYAGRLADRYHIPAGGTLELHTVLPVTAVPAASAAAPAVASTESGTATLRLFGVFPIKTVETRPQETVCVVPSGAPFGVRMLMDGAMVIGFGEVHTADGPCCPAAACGLQEGDIIRAVGSVPVTSTAMLRETALRGAPMLLTVSRGTETRQLTLTPAWSVTERCWQTGVWLRDSTAGIGTLTYQIPETGDLAGLGHPICDPDTGVTVPLASGEADGVTIRSVVRGRPGVPGCLQGYFTAGCPIGTLTCNSPCGVFGRSDTVPDGEAVPLALKQDIRIGEATILTTVSGSAPSAYDARILEIDYTDSGRDLVIEVTDPRLLDATGGIVQGMSGSPILQDGALVGAVTHVFVSDPAKGYGIFAERMYAYTEAMR